MVAAALMCALRAGRDAVEATIGAPAGTGSDRRTRASLACGSGLRHAVCARRAGTATFEIALVVAVLAMLGAIAYPSIMAYDTRANRAAAQSFMLEVANAQVRYQATHRRYATGPRALAELGYSRIPAEVADHYVVIIEPLRGPPAGFHILAMPRGTQARRDTACATLSLTHTGARAVSGQGLECWGQ